MWAGVLVLLPLLAEFATAQKCSGTPDEPEFASVRCFKKRNTCRATCQAGYIFAEKKTKFAAYECQGGEWVMKGGEETRCSPICEPACVYGECVAPNECQCDEGFSGDTCEQEDNEYAEMTTTPEPEAYEEEDNYAEEEDDYGDDYEDEEDEEDHVEYEEHEEAHAVDDEGAETTMGPEAEDDDEVEDDHHDDDDVEDETHDDHVDDDGENGDDSTDDDVDGGDDDVDGGDDDDEGEDSPQEAAYGGATEVVPKILVGSAALLMVRAL